jgi:hypothetical protein
MVLPFTVKVMTYVSGVVVELAGKVTVVLAPPLAHGNVTGKPGTGGFASNPQVLALLTFVLRTTTPPAFDKLDGVAMNEVTVGAEPAAYEGSPTRTRATVAMPQATDIKTPGHRGVNRVSRKANDLNGVPRFISPSRARRRE